MITIRLNPKLEQQVSHTAKHLGLSKSELIRKSIVDYIEKLEKQNPWELGQDLFGKYSSGQNDLSLNRKELLKDKLRAKKK
ncbi:MAG: ribbon-helix-helix protein, CopG family [Desulfobacterales bacterium]